MKKAILVLVFFAGASFSQTRLSDTDSLTTYLGSTRFPVQLDSSSSFVWRQYTLERIKRLMAGALPDDATLEQSGNEIRIKDDGVTAAKIAANAVGSSEIAANAVGSSEIANNAVGSNEMDNDAVGEPEIIDSSVTWGDLSTSLQNTINAAGGGSITNNEDDSSIKENASNQLYVNNHYGAGLDTLGADTPNISGALTFLALSPDTITNFTGNPGASIMKEVLIRIKTSNFVVTDGTINCGGVDLAPDSLDILRVIWDTVEYSCEFAKIHD